MSRSVAALALLALASCSGGPYQKYRAAHPDWDGTFPRAGGDLLETLAALQEPAHGYERTLGNVLVFRLDAPEWTALRPEEIVHAQGPLPPGDYAVAASLQCEYDDGQSRFLRGVTLWYLLPGDKLTAWDHYDFKPGCAATNRFEPARGALVESERALLHRVGECAPACAAGAAEYYAKGRAFVRAGRAADARVMLRAGDASGEGGFAVRPRVPKAHVETSAALERAALVLELGGS